MDTTGRLPSGDNLKTREVQAALSRLLCDAFGVDSRRVRKVTLTLSRDALPTLAVELIDPLNGERAKSVLAFLSGTPEAADARVG